MSEIAIDFMIKSIEALKENGKLIFISSDTFLTIKTMKGLRKFLFNIGFNKIKKVVYFSEETNYPMIILSHNKSDKRDYIELDNVNILESNITAAATTGPASGPLPTSSQPAI